MPLVAAIQLTTPSCGAVEHLEPGQRMRCIGLGGLFGAYGLVDGAPSTAVSPLSDDPHGLATVPDADCRACPMQVLPPGTRPLSAEVRPQGVRLQVLVEDDSGVADVLRSLKDSGQGPRRVAAKGAPLPASGFTVPWQALTMRQRETLEVAATLGYFEPGGADVAEVAARMGVSRSTAHEHLQKAIGRLLQGMFESG